MAELGQALRMIRRNAEHQFHHEQFSLRDALLAGLTALADPQIEARVVDHFESNPTFSRDAVHAAAIACRCRREKESLSVSRATIAQSNPVSLRP